MAMDGEYSTQPTHTFTQNELESLHIGLLLFGKDFGAIRECVLPHHKVEDIVQFYCSSYRYTKAYAHVHKLELQGFQAGCLMSGNMRNRVVRNLSSGTGRLLKSEKAIAAAFKGYDSCSLPLLELVGVLTRETGPTVFTKAVYEELETCGVSKNQLTLSELTLDWGYLLSKMRNKPEIFTSALWPALVEAGWRKTDRAEGDDTTAAATSNSAVETRHVCVDPEYIPPSNLAGELVSSSSAPMKPCRTSTAVVEAMLEAGQVVPRACIQAIREAELEETVQECLHSAVQHAPHRTVYDPAVKRPGTPTTSRKFMCANCSINTSTVWRTGNAGLTLCNACGMFYNKHDHEHRPEHLIASARAKAEAQQATVGSPGGHSLRKGSYHQNYNPDMVNSDAEMSDDAGTRRAGSESGDDDDGDDGLRRPRTRRRAQVNKWLATDDYLMLDGPLRSMSNQDFAVAAAGGSDPAVHGTDDGGDGSYGSARGRYTTSPSFSRMRRPDYGRYPYAGRGRSPDSDYCDWALDHHNDGVYGGCHYDYARRRGMNRHRMAEFDMDWQEDEMVAHDQQQIEDWQIDRPLEDMETLLGRILIHSPSDASDSSAADALVTMSKSFISQQEARRLQTAISCDMRAASGSPAPPPATWDMAMKGGGLDKATMESPAVGAMGQAHSPKIGGDATDCGEGWDAAARVKTAGRSGHIMRPEGTVPEHLSTPEKAHDMVVDTDVGDRMQLQQSNQVGHIDRDMGEATVAPEGLAQAWANLKRLNTDRSNSPTEPQVSSPTYGSPQAWHHGRQPYHNDLHFHSAPTTPYAAAGGYKQRYQHDEDMFFEQDDFSKEQGYGAAYSGSQKYADNGSRSASPSHKASDKGRQNGHNSRNAQLVDEDYPEPRGKNRSISRFGAEHKQQQDHVGGSRSNPTTPQKRERGSPVRSIRRTATGEPQRCANCGSEHTCLWRRDKGDPTRTLCNACGIYKTNNGIDRPTNGLFPSWKNGKERVVRRNVARPIFKPYKHHVLSADEYKMQKQHDGNPRRPETGALGNSNVSLPGQLSNNIVSPSAGAGHSNVEIHPGALGLTSETTAPPAMSVAGANQESNRQPSSAVTATAKGVDPSILAELTAGVATRSNSGSSTEPVGCSSTGNGAAVLSAAIAAAAAAAKARIEASSLQVALLRTAEPPAAAPAPAPPSAPSAAAAASPSTNPASNIPPAGGGEVVGNAQQPGGFGVLSNLIQQAWSHALRMHEPILLPSGHKVFPNGQVVKCQINNELGLGSSANE